MLEVTMPDTLRPGSAPPCKRLHPTSTRRILKHAVLSSANVKKRPQQRVFCSSVPGSLKRSGMKTLDVVHFVETHTDDEPPNLRKARRLVASTLLGVLLDRTQSDKWEAALKEDNLLARSHKSFSDGGKERSIVKEGFSNPNELLTERILVLQATRQNKERAKLLAGTIPAVALAAALILCSQAWAGPDIASVQDAAGWLGDFDDIKSGFLSAFLLIFFSEIGDKTFFIAAVLASRKSNAAVFTGTFGALVAMTFISVFLGRTFHYIDGILPFSLGENEVPLDDVAAVILLVYFGISTLLEAASMEVSKAEEEQQEAELAIAGLGVNGKGSTIANTAFATFGLVFVAEWGDKSFFSTVALSAASSPIGVVSGAIAGHGLATLLAVLGGSFLSTYISERVTAYIGGSLFLIFAAFTLFEIVS